jgi:hypothetical protein
MTRSGFEPRTAAVGSQLELELWRGLELVLTSVPNNRHKTGYVNQTQYKPTAGLKTIIKRSQLRLWWVQGELGSSVTASAGPKSG